MHIHVVRVGRAGRDAAPLGQRPCSLSHHACRHGMLQRVHCCTARLVLGLVQLLPRRRAGRGRAGGTGCRCRRAQQACLRLGPLAQQGQQAGPRHRHGRGTCRGRSGQRRKSGWRLGRLGTAWQAGIGACGCRSGARALPGPRGGPPAPATLPLRAGNWRARQLIEVVSPATGATPGPRDGAVCCCQAASATPGRQQGPPLFPPLMPSWDHKS